MILLDADYSFDKTAKTVTILSLHYDGELIKSIFNKTRQEFIYHYGISGKNAAFSYPGGNTLITLDYDTTSQDNTDILEITIESAATPPANIVSGSAITATTIITVPANKTWKGTVAVSASLGTTAGSAELAASCLITWNPGAGGTPTYVPCRTFITAPGSLATALNGAGQNGNLVMIDVEVYAGTTSGAFVLSHSNCDQFYGVCSGKIIN
jgi:hypothetical protein